MTYDKIFDRSLEKNEIIRGYGSFKNVFMRSKVIESGYLRCYLQIINNSTSPQSLKVGFTVSKRKARKAYVRNRIKRLLKESYRNEKHSLMNNIHMNIIFMLSDSGVRSINLLYKSGFQKFSDNMKQVFETINEEYA